MSACDSKRQRLDYRKIWTRVIRLETQANDSNQEAVPGTSGETGETGTDHHTQNIVPVEAEHLEAGQTSNHDTDAEENLSDGNDLIDNDMNLIDDIQAQHVLSSGSDSDSDGGNDNVGNDLAKWANEHQIKHRALDDLLKVLNKHFETELPTSARTLLKTVRQVNVSEKSGMEYVNLGFKEQ